MKFILIIWVCSFVQGNACMKPIEYPTLYNSWYECSRNAHIESVKLMSRMGYKYVNDYKVGTKYNCKLVPTYWQYHPPTCTLESFKTQPWSSPFSWGPWYVAIFLRIWWPWLKQSGLMFSIVGKVRSVPVARIIITFIGRKYISNTTPVKGVIVYYAIWMREIIHIFYIID